MAWIMDTISMVRDTLNSGRHGKPISLGGSQGRNEATARGCLYALREACRVKNLPLKGARVQCMGSATPGRTSPGGAAESACGGRLRFESGVYPRERNRYQKPPWSIRPKPRPYPGLQARKRYS